MIFLWQQYLLIQSDEKIKTSLELIATFIIWNLNDWNWFRFRNHFIVGVEMKWSDFFKTQLWIGIATTLPFLGPFLLEFFVEDRISNSYEQMKKPTWAPPKIVRKYFHSNILSLNWKYFRFFYRCGLFFWLCWATQVIEFGFTAVAFHLKP